MNKAAAARKKNRIASRCYSSKMRAEGFIQIGVWVPKAYRNEVLLIAEEVRRKHRLKIKRQRRKT